MRNVILTQGQTAICDCPNTPGMLTAPFPRETATLSEKSSLEMMSRRGPTMSSSSPQGAAALVMTSLEMLQQPRHTVTPNPPPRMMRLGSGEKALRRQTSTDPTISRQQKLLSWIKSKSAWSFKSRIGVVDGLSNLQQTMVRDFQEWKQLFCEGKNKHYVLKGEEIPNITENGFFILTTDLRTYYCDILDTQLTPNLMDVEYVDGDDANNSFIHCGFPPMPPFDKEVKQSIKDRMVLLMTRDQYREWWINKHQSPDLRNPLAINKMDADLTLYWELLQGQNSSHTGSFDDFFLFEKKLDGAIKALEEDALQGPISIARLTFLERKTSINGLLTLLEDNVGLSKVETEKETKNGGYKKRKSKKRTRKKKRGGRKSHYRKKRHRGKTKRYRRKTKRS